MLRQAHSRLHCSLLFAALVAWQGCGNTTSTGTNGTGGTAQKGSGGDNGEAGGSVATGTGGSAGAGGGTKTGGSVGTGDGGPRTGGSVGTGGGAGTGGASTVTPNTGGSAGSAGGASPGGATGMGGTPRNDAGPDGPAPGAGGSTTRDGGTDGAPDAPALQDTNSPVGDGSVTDLYAIGCPTTITTPIPPEVLSKLPGLGPKFAGKLINCYGLPVMNAVEVTDLAVLRDRDQVEAMLRKIAREPALNSILTTMIKRGCAAALTPVKGDICTIWAGTACGGTVRGGGGDISVVGEEDVLLQASPQWDRDFCVVIHEFTHTLHMYGIQPARPDIEKRIVAAFNAAKTAGKYTESSYDVSNEYEYIAGQVPRWFNCNPTNLNNQKGTMTDREALKAYDPDIYQLISELFDEDIFPWTPPRATVP